MDFKGMNFKKNKKNENPFAEQDKRNFLEFISDNKKMVMPLVLVAAVGLTVVIALNAGKRDINQVEEGVTVSTDENGSYIVPEVDLEKNTHEDVNALMSTYFGAYASGNLDIIKAIYTGLESTEELRLKEVSKYISEIPVVDVYTKPGPVDGSYVAYVYTEVKFNDFETALPGMQTMYVCTNESGNLYINGDVVDDRVTEYISSISLQADVVDLNNEVAAKYNDIIAANEKMAEFLSDMSANIQVSVGEALAAIESGEPVADEAEEVSGNAAGEETDVAAADASEESSDNAAESESAAEAESTEETQEASVKKTIKATDVINIRSSDSETADILGKTTKGQEFTQLEALENGWSRVEYDGKTAYVKTMYFEEVSEDTAEADANENEQTEETTEETTEKKEEAADNSDNSDNSATVSKYAKGEMRVSETVKLRKGQGTEFDSLGNVYAGDTIDVKEQYASGWAKIEYKGKTGYIKSEYLID